MGTKYHQGLARLNPGVWLAGLVYEDLFKKSHYKDSWSPGLGLFGLPRGLIGKINAGDY